MLFVLLGCLIWPQLANAQPTCPTALLEARPDFRINLGTATCAFADASRSMTLSDVLSADTQAQFAPVPGGLVDFGFSSDRFWVVARVQNASDHAGTWWVTHDMPVAQSLNVHLVRGPGSAADIVNLLSLTEGARFGDRPIAHRHLVSEIALQPQETALIVVDYTSEQATEMPFFAEALPRFFNRTQAENVEIVALTALVLGMGLISSVYLFGLAGNPAFAYSGYVLSGSALLVHMDGFSFQFIWPNWPAFNQIALPIIATTFVATGIHFVSRFTDSRSNHPVLHRPALVLILALLSFAAATPFLLATVWFKMALLGTILMGTVTQVILAATAMYRRQSGAWLLLIGFGTLAASISFGVVGYLTEGLFEQELAGRAIRLGFLIEGAAFSAAIALRVRATRLQRDASLKEQLRLSEDLLTLSEALRRAEDDRQAAARAVKRSKEALESTAHDLRQPLAALHMALSDGVSEPSRFASSLAYLEGILRDGLDPQDPIGTGDHNPPQGNLSETINASVVLRNIDLMFSAEATDQSVDLTVVPSTATVLTDPLAMMRIIGNLVSNALQHAQASRIVVGCRRTSAGIRFEVHDNGCGIEDAALHRYLQRGEKGDGSAGHGLGLSITSQLARDHGLALDIASAPGRGTRACVTVPHIPAPAALPDAVIS